MKKFEEELEQAKINMNTIWYSINGENYQREQLLKESEIVEHFKDWVSPEDHQAEVGKIELQNLKYREEIARMKKSLRKKNKAIEELNAAVKKIKLDRDEWKTEANQLDKEKDRLITETEQLKSQIGKQQPVIPEFMAEVIENNDLETLTNWANLVPLLSTQVRSWLLSSDLVGHSYTYLLADLKINGYTVETPKVIVTPCPVCGYEEVESNFCSICGRKNDYE